MKIQAGHIIENVLRAMHRQSDRSEDREHVERLLNIFYFEVSAMHAWFDLRRDIVLDFNTLLDDDEEGLLLPANLLGIRRVRDEVNDIEFIPRDQEDALEPDEEGFRYFMHVPDANSLFVGNDAFVNEGGTVFISSADLGANDFTGEFIRFGRELGYYQLTAATTFAPSYDGPDLSEVRFRIRPRGTRRLVIIDRSEVFLRDREVRVFYWEAPPPLYDETDEILLPDPTVLELMLLKSLPETKERRPVTDRQIFAALNQAKSMNPDNPRKNVPRDQHNRIFDFTRGQFARRRRTPFTDTSVPFLGRIFR